MYARWVLLMTRHPRVIREEGLDYGIINPKFFKTVIPPSLNGLDRLLRYQTSLSEETLQCTRQCLQHMLTQQEEHQMETLEDHLVSK